MSYFHLFSLPVGFELDQAALDVSYFAQQRVFHPDRFVGKPEAERMAALQHSADVNKAYETLKNPLKRAQYLLSLQDINASKQDASPALLGEVMEWREDVHGAESPAQIEGLKAKLHAIHEETLGKIGTTHDAKDWPAMTQLVLKLGYVLKTQEEIISRQIKLHQSA